MRLKFHSNIHLQVIRFINFNYSPRCLGHKRNKIESTVMFSLYSTKGASCTLFPFPDGKNTGIFLVILNNTSFDYVLRRKISQGCSTHRNNSYFISDGHTLKKASYTSHSIFQVPFKLINNCSITTKINLCIV